MKHMSWGAIEGRDFCVRYINLPIAVHGTVALDETGFYNIYINANQSAESQQKAIEHELKHIERNDFDKEDHPLDDVEDF